MLFRRIIFNALLVGIVCGLLMSIVNHFSVSPIIFAAEAYEIADEAEVLGIEAAGHSHDHAEEAWAPEDGGERTLFTFLSNIFAGIGFASLLLAAMSQVQLLGLSKLDVKKGALWGLCGFIALFLMPGLGLPPEIPGVEAEAVENRQLWWTLTVLLSILALAVLAFAPAKFKASALAIAALPFLIGAPHIAGPAFTHPDPAAVAALTALHEQFIIASAISNFVFWLLLGVASAWVLNRWVLKGLDADAELSH